MTYTLTMVYRPPAQWTVYEKQAALHRLERCANFFGGDLEPQGSGKVEQDDIGITSAHLTMIFNRKPLAPELLECLKATGFGALIEAKLISRDGSETVFEWRRAE